MIWSRDAAAAKKGRARTNKVVFIFVNERDVEKEWIRVARKRLLCGCADEMFASMLLVVQTQHQVPPSRSQQQTGQSVDFFDHNHISIEMPVELLQLLRVTVEIVRRA